MRRNCAIPFERRRPPRSGPWVGSQDALEPCDREQRAILASTSHQPDARRPPGSKPAARRWAPQPTCTSHQIQPRLPTSNYRLSRDACWRKGHHFRHARPTTLRPWRPDESGRQGTAGGKPAFIPRAASRVRSRARARLRPRRGSTDPHARPGDAMPTPAEIPQKRQETGQVIPYPSRARADFGGFATHGSKSFCATPPFGCRKVVSCARSPVGVDCACPRAPKQRNEHI